MLTKTGQTAKRRMGNDSRARWLATALVVFTLAMIVSAVPRPGGKAQARPLLDVSGTPGAIGPTGKLEAVATPAATRAPARWEGPVLQALADALSWPTEIVEGPGGKLSVGLEVSGRERYEAWIRPFETEAGAGAAFSAETEDLMLAGLRVSSTQFYTYPAYVATLADANGQTIERRLAWHVDEWIMGVAVTGSTQASRSFDLQLTGRHLLYLAVQQGVPSPPGGVQPPGGTPTAAPTATNCEVEFGDVPPSHWAAPYILQLACDGIVSGYADGNFKPQNPTTRAQLAKMLALSEDWDLADPETATFSDVPPSHLFFRYIETAFREGVVSGYPNGLFRPDVYVTRAQVAKMLVVARGWELGDEFSTTFCDVPTTHWAWAYIHTTVERGAFRGYANGCFAPDAIATRAQLAKVLVNAVR